MIKERVAVKIPVLNDEFSVLPRGVIHPRNAESPGIHTLTVRTPVAIATEFMAACDRRNLPYNQVLVAAMELWVRANAAAVKPAQPEPAV